MIIYFYNKNNESYSLPKYTVIEDNKSLFKLKYNKKEALKIISFYMIMKILM